MLLSAACVQRNSGINSWYASKFSLHAGQQVSVMHSNANLKMFVTLG